MPQPKPLIETQNVTNEGNQDKVQEDGNAPNAEVKNKEDESKEETPEGNKQPDSKGVPSKGTTDDDQNPKDDGAKEANDGKSLFCKCNSSSIEVNKKATVHPSSCQPPLKCNSSTVGINKRPGFCHLQANHL
ncbi:hypothetical protein P8452_22211 [Trifolium repens]|nr:hypothetical protein P8452_22211 [Trifolium repens]